MIKPICAQKQPYVLMGEKKRYAWCACGKSDKQPFCDGSHNTLWLMIWTGAMLDER